MQYPIRTGPILDRLSRDRSECPVVQKFCARLKGDRLPIGVCCRETRGWSYAPQASQSHDGRHPGVLRARHGLHRGEDAQVGSEEISSRLEKDWVGHEISRGGHGHWKNL